MKSKIIGYAAVDSGQLLIVDPCYLGEWKAGEVKCTKNGAVSNAEDNHYAECVEKTLSFNGGGSLVIAGTAGEGVVFETGYGDGYYPVTAHYNEDGRIIKVTVDFK